MRITIEVSIIVFGFVICSPLLRAQPTSTLPSPQTPQSESTGPQDPRSTGGPAMSAEPLSERLERDDGVIRPPPNISPEMTVRPRVPDPGTTLVIPPPGSPGGDQNVQPK